VTKGPVELLLLQIQGILKTIGILDVIDTALVAYFLYRIYLMLKHTRAAALVKGLIVLVFLMVLSRWLNLHVINWILEKLMTVVMIALPVVFQPELRRALEQIGRGRLFHKTTELDEQELEEVIGAVTSAAVVMSQRKVGALIVFERETGLEERIETGVQIDGLVSDSLLLNIFEKDTPLHDGAVIIRGKRIVAASCLLPLTDARNLSQELGTRHRAALGISEQSDAIVLVVSEETGTISLAKNGELLRYLQADDVRELLRAGIMTQLKPKAGLLEQLRQRFQGEKK
jgi:diadenylate cyclase